MRKRNDAVLTVAGLVAACLAACAAAAAATDAGSPRWVGSWAASQQAPEPRNALATEDLKDATLRQTIRLSLGGAQLRLRLSNRFGTMPLHFSAVHIARPVAPGSSAILAESDKALAFSGSPDVTIPAGADYVSDTVAFTAAPLSDLAITLHIDEPPAQQTGHPGSRTTSYFTHGNLVSAADLPDAKKVDHWYFIAGLEVMAPPQAAAIITMGDSITDGSGSTTNGNNRWPDVLSARLRAEPRTQSFAVLNHGIGGNRLLLDGLGPNALARFDRDVLAQPGARYLIVLEGVNDLGMTTREHEVSQGEHDALVRHIEGAYQQMIVRSHAHGIQVIGATILPFTGSGFYHPGAATEADRQAINQWIRTPGNFDAVVDFDQVTRDPEHPERMLAEYDSGDHLHPSAAGYKAMASAIPLSLFSAAPATAPKLALTFDDLPKHGPLPDGLTRTDVAKKILAAFRDAGMPAIYGFLNGQRVEQEPPDEGFLEAWRAAGQPLGNHTWSHMRLNDHSLEEFEAEVLRNEPMLRKWMRGRDWHWFRYPYLSEGDTAEKRAGARAILAKRGYRVAAVTMSFDDYLWNEPYARCSAKGDAKEIASLEESYLAAADANITYVRSLSWQLYGRDIPYVLLMHVGAFDAEILPRLLALYRDRGFEFVTLEQAESDPAYQIDTDLRLPPGADTLEAEMAARQLAIPSRPSYAAQLEATCH